MLKVDKASLKIFSIMIVLFEVVDKKKKFSFFEETFLLANLKINVVLDMIFLTLLDIKLNFIKFKLL